MAGLKDDVEGKRDEIIEWEFENTDREAMRKIEKVPMNMRRRDMARQRDFDPVDRGCAGDSRILKGGGCMCRRTTGQTIPWRAGGALVRRAS